jgi:hypothetical protein
MGISLFSSNSSSEITPDTETYPNPNPYRFEVLDITESAKYFMLVLKYLDCTEYEGKKVLVYKIKHKEDVEKMLDESCIDPHFLENRISPIARFPGNVEGIVEAIKYINIDC